MSEAPISIHIRIEKTDDGEATWWADSPQAPGFTACAPSLPILRQLVYEALVNELYVDEAFVAHLEVDYG